MSAAADADAGRAPKRARTEPASGSVAANVAASVAELRRRAPDGFAPKVGIILGSGMGDVAKSIENAVAVPYSELTGFSVSTVHGHAGNVVMGTLRGVEVACLQGRVHLYEGGPASAVLNPIYTLQRLGCKVLLATTAVGSLRANVGPGDVVVVNDHINMQGCNPLIGPNNDEFGVRFPSLQDAYDPELRTMLHAAARKEELPEMTEGVYLSCLGPSFETPAEIRAFKIMGADVVGMSLVAEIIAARHCGMRCAALSIVVNLASGMSEVEITHDETLHYTGQVAAKVAKLTLAFVKDVDAVLRSGDSDASAPASAAGATKSSS